MALSKQTAIRKYHVAKNLYEEKDIEIMLDNFKRDWKWVNEGTLQSIAGLHHGHYKPASKLDVLYKALSLQMTVVVRSRIPPDRWSIAL